MAELKLKHGLEFADLYHRDGLVKLDVAFCDFLREVNADLYQKCMTARTTPNPDTDKYLIIDLAPYVEDFIGDFFGITSELQKLRATHNEKSNLYACKRLFIQRRAARVTDIANINIEETRAALQKQIGKDFTELDFANAVMGWLDNEKQYETQLELAKNYAAWAIHTNANPDGVLFKQPKKLDLQNLVHLETEEINGVRRRKMSAGHLRARNGFSLTDSGCDITLALDQANYCIFCHNQNRDSCATGLHDKQTGMVKKNDLDITLAGCPLDEKISEMNITKSQGHALGAVAIAAIDNPMMAGTGHRICNDCMKSCVYQKQEPVNIPQIETNNLKNILDLPWGVEIYSLLTRWNPLNFSRPLPKPSTDYKILVVGMGPAGYTLAHHLINDGHNVVAIDGLKIEPFDLPFAPIKSWQDWRDDLSTRTLDGFGGVAEYGITVRWDKNFLKLIRLLLQRRDQFTLHGGVRFGGTITIDQAFDMGFDHIALCMGAGKPQILDIKNALAPGVRAASDFLMALQLTGAAKTESLANLQIRLPVVVIGGGLTAIDTATEALAYYPVQVEKFLTRYEKLPHIRDHWNEQETKIADEFIAHARALRAERKKPNPDILKLLQSWGGSTIAYRKNLVDAPSYRLNHEEVELAMQEGIFFVENATPQEVLLDDDGHAAALQCDGATLPAKTILIAAGTQPNIVLAREDHTIEMDGKYFRAIDVHGNPVTPEKISKPATPHVLTHLRDDGRAISFLGDLHPSFAGNVVKAMGSAKQGYPVISNLLHNTKPVGTTWKLFQSKIDDGFTATVREVKRLTPTIIEIIVRAPFAARNFEPGQFYRLQNFEKNAPLINNTRMAMEGLALTGAWVDKEQGLISLITLEMGGSSDLCTLLKPDEKIVVMGPTGAPTEIPQNETVLLAGGGLGNAVLFSIGKALRARGSKVLYFAAYKKSQDRFKLHDIEAAADLVVWCCDEQPDFNSTRPQDKIFHGNIIEAMLDYARNEKSPIKLHDVNRIIAIGSDRMMNAVATARHTVLKPYLQKHEAIGSINSPMQCMMKEICAQCVQQHIDPHTGEKSVVFSCFNQDQNLDTVDFNHLRARLGQNTVQEKLTAAWIDDCLKTMQIRNAA